MNRPRGQCVPSAALRRGPYTRCMFLPRPAGLLLSLPVLVLVACTAAPGASPSAVASGSPEAARAAATGGAATSPAPAPSPAASPAGSPRPGTSVTPTVSATPSAVVSPTPVPRPLGVPRTAVEIDRGAAGGRDIALTFDCAANSGPTQEILDVLAQENVSVTFFMVGIWARDHQDLTKQIAQRHELGNHSYEHPDYRDWTDTQIAADLQRNEDFLFALTGKSTKPLWRAPSGARDDRVLEAAAAAGWPWHIFWTIGRDTNGTVTGDSGDWRGISGPEVEANNERAARLGGGVITVSHCDAPGTASTIRDTVRYFRAQGLRIVTVSELLRGMGR